jgi:integrase/recombinase XerD
MKNRTLTDADIAAYASFLRQEERAPATIENYLRDIRVFRRWLEDRAVTKERVAEWKEHLLAKALAPATVNAKLSAVSGLLGFLGLGECRVKSVRIQRRVFRDEARELTREEYRRLLNTAQRQGLDRLLLLMETICATGVRVSEVCHITVEALRDMRADVALKGKVRSILLPRKLCRKLLKYAKRKKITSGEIFRTRSGRPMSRGQIWREMKAICQAAGVAPSKVFPHNLRHLFATVFYRASRDIAKLADLLGHSSIDTTRLYLMTTGAEHARQLEQLDLIL